jgi:hypothetical protein
MWDPQSLTILWAFTACYKERFTFFYLVYNYLWNLLRNVNQQIRSRTPRQTSAAQVLDNFRVRHWRIKSWVWYVLPVILPPLSYIFISFYFLLIFSFTHLSHIIRRICNKCICSVSTDSWMSYDQWRNSYTFFVHLGIILILVLGFYSGLSGRVRTAYLFSLCVASLLFSRFTVSALVCTRRKPAPVPLCPPQIPHNLTRPRTRAPRWEQKDVNILVTTTNRHTSEMTYLHSSKSENGRCILLTACIKTTPICQTGEFTYVKKTSTAIQWIPFLVYRRLVRLPERGISPSHSLYLYRTRPCYSSGG